MNPRCCPQFSIFILLLLATCITTISGDGWYDQINYAKRAAGGRGIRCIGVSCKDGALLVTASSRATNIDDSSASKSHSSERNETKDDGDPPPPLKSNAPTRILISSSCVGKISKVDMKGHLWVALTGIPSDCRHLLQVMKDVAATYRSNFGLTIPLERLVDEVSSYLYEICSCGDMRPLAVSAVLVGPSGAVSASAAPSGAVLASAAPSGAVSASAAPSGEVSASAAPSGAVSASAAPSGAVSASAASHGTVGKSSRAAAATAAAPSAAASDADRPIGQSPKDALPAEAAREEDDCGCDNVGEELFSHRIAPPPLSVCRLELDGQYGFYHACTTDIADYSVGMSGKSGRGAGGMDDCFAEDIAVTVALERVELLTGGWASRGVEENAELLEGVLRELEVGVDDDEEDGEEKEEEDGGNGWDGNERGKGEGDEDGEGTLTVQRKERRDGRTEKRPYHIVAMEKIWSPLLRRRQRIDHYGRKG